MGEIMDVRCSACGAKWRCMEGSGLLYGKKENIIAAFAQQEQPEVIAQIERSKIPAYDFNFRLTVCSRCKNVVNVPVLGTVEGETHVGACPACGSRVEILTSELEKTACPVCKNKALKVEEDGHWD